MGAVRALAFGAVRLQANGRATGCLASEAAR